MLLADWAADAEEERAMKLERVEIENYRAIEKLDLPLDPALTVFHGANGHGKTSVLGAIAAGLGGIPMLLPEVSGVGFLKTDRRGLRPLRVKLRTRDGIEWERRLLGRLMTGGPRSSTGQRSLKEAMEAIVAADREEAEPCDLPIVAFYDTDRAAFDVPHPRRNLKTEFPRYAALEGAFAPRPNFRELFRWFYAMEYEELQEKNERRDWNHQLPELKVVRKAIMSMAPGVSDPRIKLRPLRFAVSVESEAGKPEELALDQLSGGYRIVLALAADLARRMAQGNPHLADPLESEAVVLIDEVDLHLHPGWQQRVLVDLRRTFPNTQFIVSTHSPQVLTTVRPEHIVELRREDGRIVAGRPSAPIFGAEAGDVLFTVMKVDERPDNEFKTTLDDYMRLVEDRRGRSEPAVALRKELQNLSVRDPALDAADMEMERQEIFERLGKAS